MTHQTPARHIEDARELADVPKSSIRGIFLTSVLMVVVLSVALGVVYPLVTMGVGQLLFPEQANGSLITNRSGQVVGSELIGQAFTKPRYFWPRLSASNYDATASGGTNLGPTNKALLKVTIAEGDLIRKADGLPWNYVLPADAVSTSASGLDPNISPAYAALQVHRVATARGLSDATVRAVVAKYTSQRTFGVLGEPRVNVPQLNLSLDGLGKGNARG